MGTKTFISTGSVSQRLPSYEPQPTSELSAIKDDRKRIGHELGSATPKEKRDKKKNKKKREMEKGLEAESRRQDERAASKKQRQTDKIFRRAMKAKKRQASNCGVEFDPEKAAKEILEEKEKQKSSSKSAPESKPDGETGRGSNHDSDSSTDSCSTSNKGSDSVTKAANTQSHITPSVGIANSEDEAAKVPNIKKAANTKDAPKDLANPTGDGDTSMNKKRHKKRTITLASESHPIADDGKKIEHKEKHGNKREKKRKNTNIATEAAELDLDKRKKRKRSRIESENSPLDVLHSEKSHKSKKVKVKDTAAPSEEAPNLEAQLEKRHKKKKSRTEPAETLPEMVNSMGTKPEKHHRHKETKIKVEKPSAVPSSRPNAAEQWNPDALTGDEARKAKFLRLLGAGKSNGPTVPPKPRPNTDTAAIMKVQSELERQYEAGMKLKHDGGSKRRGIGA